MFTCRLLVHGLFKVDKTAVALVQQLRKSAGGIDCTTLVGSSNRLEPKLCQRAVTRLCIEACDRAGALCMRLCEAEQPRSWL